MKIRKLRKSIDAAIKVVTFLLLVFFVGLDDFEIEGLPWLIMCGLMLFINVKLLKKYGR